VQAIFANLERIIDDPVWERSYTSKTSRSYTAEAVEKVDKIPVDVGEDTAADATKAEE
jgi:hypothetical protein